MIQILKEKYFSKADAFILPLTGLGSTKIFKMKSYLFWEDYSIEDYSLILTYRYDDKNEFIKYFRTVICPILDKGGYLVESYDYEGMTVLVLDLSEWTFSIEMFLKGKYSKMSKAAKDKIEVFHTYYVKDEKKTAIHIYAALYPKEKVDPEKGDILGKLTPIEYVAKNYGLPLPELQTLGELCTIYNITAETLTIKQENVDNLETV